MPGYIGIMVDMRAQPPPAANADYEFGLCLSAGPVTDTPANPAAWPPVQANAPFDLYCPWDPVAWPWWDAAPQAPANGSLGWSVWVQHSADASFTWYPLPAGCCRFYSVPTDNAGNVDPAYASYNTGLSSQVVALKLLGNNQWQAHANSTNFAALLSNPANGISEGDLPAAQGSTDAAPVSHDALMVLLSRRATSRPPFNFGARLSWHLTLDRAGLDAALTAIRNPPPPPPPVLPPPPPAWPDSNAASMRFCAFPYRQTNGFAQRVQTLAGGTDSALAASACPGLAGGDQGVPFKMACNPVAAPAVVPNALPVLVELTPWRAQLVERTARFLDFPRLLLDLAIGPKDANPQPWEAWAAQITAGTGIEKNRRMIQNLWLWVVGSSADLYTAGTLGRPDSLWDYSGGGAMVPPAVQTLNRQNPTDWLAWLANPGVPSDDPALAKNATQPTQGQLAAGVDVQRLAVLAQTRLQPDFLTSGSTNAPTERKAMLAELDLMSQFVNNVHSLEAVDWLLPLLWEKAGVARGVYGPLRKTLDGTALDNGNKPSDELIDRRRSQAAQRLAQSLVLNWKQVLLAEHGSSADAANEMITRLGGANGLLRDLYADRVAGGAGVEPLVPLALPSLGAQFETDLADAPQSRKDWLVGDDSVPLQEPHGFTLPVAAEQPTPVDHAIDSSDALQERAGHLIFGRAEGKPWRCLNQAILRLADGTPLTGVPLAVPMDTPFNGDQLQATVLYNNRPLSAPSPRNSLVGNPNHRLADTDTVNDSLDGPDYLFPRPNPPVPATDLGVLPGLVYGRKYNFATLPLTNACSLPEALRDARHPALFDFAKLKLLADFDQVPGASVYQDGGSNSISYLRRVGISAPRVIALGYEKKGNWPTVPDDVFPLAAEVRPVAKGDPEEPMAVLFPTRPAQGALASATGVASALRLEIRKPTTDIENWDRWVAKGDKTPAERAAVWADVFYERDTTKTTPTQAPDDPAVGSHLLVEIESLYPAAPRRLYAVPYLSAIVGTIHADPILCEFQIAAPGASAAAPVVNFKRITISVASGQVLRATLHNLVSTDFCDFTATPASNVDPRLDGKVFPATDNLMNQFPGVLCTSIGGAAFPSLGKWQARSSHTFRVEAAVDTMPTEEELWNALTPVASGDRVLLNLKYSALSTDALAYVSALDIQQQIWRWNGRPACTDQFPVPTLAPNKGQLPEDQLAAWDGIGFHDRADSQHRLTHARLTYRDASANPTVLLQTEDYANDLRALYNRFGLTAYNRYHGVLGKTVQARRTHDLSLNLIPPDPWRRLLLPARLRQPLKRPLVKAFLPLTASGTEATDSLTLNPAASPGFLLLLAEPFYEQAGLAEKLDCEISVAYVDLENPPGHPLPRAYYLQAGFDPVLSRRALDPIDKPTGANVATRRLDLEAPIGLTFDVGATDPLIVSTGFMGRVPAELKAFPSPKEYGEPSAANTFFQVRVRRVVDPGALSADADADVLASEWSDSAWLRLLPDAISLLSAWPPQADGTRALTRNNQRISVARWTAPTPWHPKDAPDFNQSRFSYAILISRMVPDISGRLREIYVCALRAGDDGQCTLCDATGQIWPGLLTQGIPCQARIIELFQRRPNDVTPLWERLFPEITNPLDPAPDADARIERMSPPFPITIQ